MTRGANVMFKVNIFCSMISTTRGMKLNNFGHRGQKDQRAVSFWVVGYDCCDKRGTVGVVWGTHRRSKANVWACVGTPRMVSFFFEKNQGFRLFWLLNRMYHNFVTKPRAVFSEAA